MLAEQWDCVPQCRRMNHGTKEMERKQISLSAIKARKESSCCLGGRPEQNTYKGSLSRVCKEFRRDPGHCEEI